jgi:hypothetical protein
MELCMSYIVSPFEVTAKALSAPAQVRFVHLFPAIATRHSDTIDCWFRVNGQRVTVSISCAALTELRRERGGTVLGDQQIAEIAALHLRRTLERGYDPTGAELFIDLPNLRKLGGEAGYL